MQFELTNSTTVRGPMTTPFAPAARENDTQHPGLRHPNTPPPPHALGRCPE